MAQNESHPHSLLDQGGAPFAGGECDAEAIPLLTQRCPAGARGPVHDAALRLALAADDRTRLRGHRRCLGGQAVLLQLERGAPLRPGEWLGSGDGRCWVQVEAAPELLLVVRGDPIRLLRAAYHLGNRHVALEVGRDELRLLEDSVLEAMLRGLAVRVQHCQLPFSPERGVYGDDYAHGHSHRDQVMESAAHPSKADPTCERPLP